MSGLTKEIEELIRGQRMLHQKQRELLQAIIDRRSDLEEELQRDVATLSVLVTALLEKVQQGLRDEKNGVSGS